MFENLFGESSYYDYPSFEIALYSLLLSFLLSTVIGLTYKFTYEGHNFPKYFFQAIVLSSMVTCMVIMAVGNNLAAGFGIIGAVAIIRFRTMIRNPRNIIFIFSSLSVGIATGVYGYAIAIAGSFLFSFIALLLHFSPFGKVANGQFDLILTTTQQSSMDALLSFLEERNIKNRTVSFRKLDRDKGYKYNLQLSLDNKQITDELFNELISFPGFTEVRINAAEESQL